MILYKLFVIVMPIGSKHEYHNLSVKEHWDGYLFHPELFLKNNHHPNGMVVCVTRASDYLVCITNHIFIFIHR